jgi:hypothetical protein
MYTHLKSGGLYFVLGVATNYTNMHQGKKMVVYHKKVEPSRLFVREVTEFLIKFKPAPKEV